MRTRDGTYFSERCCYSDWRGVSLSRFVLPTAPGQVTKPPKLVVSSGGFEFFARCADLLETRNALLICICGTSCKSLKFLDCLIPSTIVWRLPSNPYSRGGHMKLLCVHRISCASLVVMGTLALGSTSFAPRAAAQSASPTPQGEPQRPGEERRREQRGAQPQSQPQRPGNQSSQPQAPRHEQRQQTEQERRPGSQGQQGTPQPGERRQPPGTPQQSQPRTTQQPGQAPGTPGATQPRTTQQPGQAPGTPGATQPRTTQQPAQPPGAPSQATQQPTTQMPGTDRQDLHRPPTSGAPAPSANTQ